MAQLQQPGLSVSSGASSTTRVLSMSGHSSCGVRRLRGQGGSVERAVLRCSEFPAADTGYALAIPPVSSFSIRMAPKIIEGSMF